MYEKSQTGKSSFAGFTLTELLVVLGILSMIATFTIPKVILAQQNDRRNAIAKEAAAMMASAYTSLKYDKLLTVNSSPRSLENYLNYVSKDTSGSIDGCQGQTSFSCTTNTPCLILHNGAKIMLNGCTFSVLDGTHSIAMLIDPDATVSPLTTGPQKGMFFFLYADGRIVDLENLLPNTSYCAVTYGPVAGSNPDWFKWSR